MCVCVGVWEPRALHCVWELHSARLKSWSGRRNSWAATVTRACTYPNPPTHLHWHRLGSRYTHTRTSHHKALRLDDCDKAAALHSIIPAAAAAAPSHHLQHSVRCLAILSARCLHLHLLLVICFNGLGFRKRKHCL